MPVSRWKSWITVVALYLCHEANIASSFQNAISANSGGWRPIIGPSRETPDEITQYRNPSQSGSEPVPANPQPLNPPSTPSTTDSRSTHDIVSQPSTTHDDGSSTTSQVPTTSKIFPLPTNISSDVFQGNTINQMAHVFHGEKLPPHSKRIKPLLVLPSRGGYGPQIIPLTRSSTQGQYRIPVIAKIHPLGAMNTKRHVKPIRNPVIAHSTKNEVYVPASSSAIGSYAFFNQGPAQIKTRDTPGGKQYHLPQPHGHLQFATHLNLPGNNDAALPNAPIQTYLFQSRSPLQNDIHVFVNQNDFPRNLVPPPFKPIGQKDKLKPHVDVGVTEQTASVSNAHLVIGKHKDVHHRATVPENYVVQLPPPYGQQIPFEATFQQQINNKPTVDVQITKEKFKVYHNTIPNHYEPTRERYPVYESIEDVKQVSKEPSWFENFKFQPATEQKPPKDKFPQFDGFSKLTNFEQPKRTHIHPQHISVAPNYPTYEVTEGKTVWPNSGFQITTKPPEFQQGGHFLRNPPIIPPPSEVLPFLPTPYSPDAAIPTLPSQSEVSSVYSDVSQKNRNKYSTIHPGFFNIKEVSTHFPVFGRPESPPPVIFENDQYNEIPTTTEDKRNQQIYQAPEDEPESTILPTKPPTTTTQRTRPHQRRRRPTPQRTRTPSTTADSYASSEEYARPQTPTEHPHSEETRPTRKRRPTHRYRTSSTTTTTPESYEAEPTQPSIPPKKHKRPVHTANHQATEEIYSGEEVRPQQESYTVSDIVNRHKTDRPHVTNSFENEFSNLMDESTSIETDAMNYKHSTQTNTEFQTQANTLSNTEEYTERQYKTPFRHHSTTAVPGTTEQMPTANILTPENEAEQSTLSPNYLSANEEVYNKIGISKTENEVESTLATTPVPVTTTTTETTTTSKSHRIRGRPIKYDKTRPRFSVKEYRQRLNQYSSTSTETPPRSSSTDMPLRVRFPIRRKPTTTPVYNQDESETTERTKFVPNNVRHRGTTTEETTVITEKSVKVNTRLRPFGRYRSTSTTSTTESIANLTPKISLKPNIYSSLRRPTPISLRSKIMSKYNRTNPVTTIQPIEENTEETQPDSSHVLETTLLYNLESETDAEFDSKKQTGSNTDGEPDMEESATDILKNVSDLTSLAKKDYDTPGLFKNVAPISRGVPNHFTIATDDPILPIEAFFPNIKDRTARSESVKGKT